MAVILPPINPTTPNGIKLRSGPSHSESRNAFPQELNRARGPKPADEPKLEKPAPSKKPAKNAAKKNEKSASDNADDGTERDLRVEKKGKSEKPEATDEATTDEVAATDEVTESDRPEDADPDAVTAEASLAAAAAAAAPATKPAVQAESVDADEEADGDATDLAVGALNISATDEEADPARQADGDATDDTAEGETVDELAVKRAPEHAPSQKETGHVLGENEAAEQKDPAKQALVAAKLADVESDAAAVDPSAVAPVDAKNVPAGHASELEKFVDTLSNQVAALGDAGAKSTTAVATTQAAAATPPEVRFSETNHANIVTGMKAELMPNGGTMRIRLDPPQLGALQVTVQMRDGVMTASFETSNDEATKLLSHSLQQLKTSLESQGVTIDKIQVQQGPRDTQANSQGEDGQQQREGQQQDQSARQEQQRKEMVRRMWRRLSGQADPLDVTG